MVSPISNGVNRPSMPVPLSPEQAFQHIDTTGKGFITESDLASAVVSISAEGAKLSQSEARTNAQEAFKKLDRNQDGKVTQSEFVATAPKAPDAGETVPIGPAGHRGGGGPVGAGSTSSNETSLTYASADTNQDGTVSALEALVYGTKHVSIATETA